MLRRREKDFIRSLTFYLIFRSSLKIGDNGVEFPEMPYMELFFLLHYFKVSMIYGAQTRDVMIVINLNRWEEKANRWSRRGIWLWDLTLPAPNLTSSTWISAFGFAMQGRPAMHRSLTLQTSLWARAAKRRGVNVKIKSSSRCSWLLFDKNQAGLHL